MAVAGVSATGSAGASGGAAGWAISASTPALARDASDAVVGVADATGFPLANRQEVIEVQLALEAPDNVENWGAGPSCVAWARAGRANAAVVRGDDRDCDGVLAGSDCNDLAYCAPGDSSCSTAISLCQASCSVGCRVNNVCESALCLPAAACADNAACRTATTLAERLACVAGQATQVKIGLLDTGRPCVDTFVLPLPTTTHCSNPLIEYAEPLADRYTFEVTDGATSCGFSIKKPSNAGAFSGTHHLLVSIDPPNGTGPRPTFFIAVTGVPRVPPMQACANPVSIDSQVAINRCQ